MSQKILAVKLRSGEEIIGRVENDGDNTLTLSHVRAIQLVPTGPQQLGVMIVPYVASNEDGDITFHREAMACVPFEPKNPDVEKQYMQQTTSIALPT